MGNSVIFPAPKERKVPFWMESHLRFYTKAKKEEDEPEPKSSFLFFCCSDRKIVKKIPYLHFKEDTETQKNKYLIIYFHGNSELLTHTFKALERYHSILRVSLLAAEYPGYGFYDNESANEANLLEDAEQIIRFCMNGLNYKEENIILMGRSMGTGVAAQMGIKFPQIRGIIMISPFLSIRDVAKNMIGEFMSKFVPDIFRTKDVIENIKCPMLFLHGLKDQLVPCTNSSYLYDHCNAPKMINLSPTMDHNKLDFRIDLYLPILKFLVEKLKMLEFQEDYNNEDIDRVSALGSQEKIPMRKGSLSPKSGTNCNFDNSEPTDFTATKTG